MSSPTVVCFHRDLRLADNPALAAAIGRGSPVVPVCVHAPEEEGDWAPGAAARWWLHHSLAALDDELRQRGSRLVLRRGDRVEQLLAVAAAVGARTVCWNRRFEPALLAHDLTAATALRERGLAVEDFNGSLLVQPWDITTAAGRPYRVFTPFHRRLGKAWRPGPLLPTPATVPAPIRWPASLALPDLGLLPAVDWAGSLRAAWQPGRRGAEAQLATFLAEAWRHYPTGRERPASAGTSRLSPYLHWGELSPREVWQALAAVASGTPPATRAAAAAYQRQLAWREFAYHVLYHFPRTPDQPLHPEFAAFPWQENPAWLRAWRQGRTGFPIVDAGLRELWHTGWMHNRVRMIVASFLVKDLLVPWLAGARWFWDTLVDADLANNTLGWQWAAGCGADAAPFFRVFNPVSQGEQFDPDGAYVRRWVPTLARLDRRWVHRPWTAPPAALAAADVALGRNYPQPLVDHAAARRQALAAWQRLRRG